MAISLHFLISLINLSILSLATIIVSTEKFDLPEGTQSGTSFTLRGKGIPNLGNGSRRGDLIFTVTVEIPTGLSAKQKDAMHAFAEACGESNYKKKKNFFKKSK